MSGSGINSGGSPSHEAKKKNRGGTKAPPVQQAFKEPKLPPPIKTIDDPRALNTKPSADNLPEFRHVFSPSLVPQYRVATEETGPPGTFKVVKSDIRAYSEALEADKINLMFEPWAGQECYDCPAMVRITDYLLISGRKRLPSRQGWGYLRLDDGRWDKMGARKEIAQPRIISGDDVSRDMMLYELTRGTSLRDGDYDNFLRTLSGDLSPDLRLPDSEETVGQPEANSVPRVRTSNSEPETAPSGPNPEGQRPGSTAMANGPLAGETAAVNRRMAVDKVQQVLGQWAADTVRDWDFLQIPSPELRTEVANYHLKKTQDCPVLQSAVKKGALIPDRMFFNAAALAFTEPQIQALFYAFHQRSTHRGLAVTTRAHDSLRRPWWELFDKRGIKSEGPGPLPYSPYGSNVWVGEAVLAKSWVGCVPVVYVRWYQWKGPLSATWVPEKCLDGPGTKMLIDYYSREAGQRWNAVPINSAFGDEEPLTLDRLNIMASIRVVPPGYGAQLYGAEPGCPYLSLDEVCSHTFSYRWRPGKPSPFLAPRPVSLPWRGGLPIRSDQPWGYYAPGL